ncbi:hypothetical protein [Mesoterricola sediminis]|uniref:hypothetical protein n=1 Tax=Mesoterricola sediminis TaxID=2927980 RepID=UPI00292CE10B|nr:hypothetical protein [Mesoterricola sediminis]
MRKRFYIVYSSIWLMVTIAYLMSCFDGAYSEWMYQGVEVVTWPWVKFLGDFGLGLEKKYSFSFLILLSRIGIEVGIPALLDLFLVEVLLRGVKRVRR